MITLALGFSVAVCGCRFCFVVVCALMLWCSVPCCWVQDVPLGSYGNSHSFDNSRFTFRVSEAGHQTLQQQQMQDQLQSQVGAVTNAALAGLPVPSAQLASQQLTMGYNLQQQVLPFPPY